jgi:hypothetical protein
MPQTRVRIGRNGDFREDDGPCTLVQRQGDRMVYGQISLFTDTGLPPSWRGPTHERISAALRHASETGVAYSLMAPPGQLLIGGNDERSRWRIALDAETLRPVSMTTQVPPFGDYVVFRTANFHTLRPEQADAPFDPARLTGAPLDGAPASVESTPAHTYAEPAPQLGASPYAGAPDAETCRIAEGDVPQSILGQRRTLRYGAGGSMTPLEPAALEEIQRDPLAPYADQPRLGLSREGASALLGGEVLLPDVTAAWVCRLMYEQLPPTVEYSAQTTSGQVSIRVRPTPWRGVNAAVRAWSSSTHTLADCEGTALGVQPCPGGKGGAVYWGDDTHGWAFSITSSSAPSDVLLDLAQQTIRLNAADVSPPAATETPSRAWGR